MFFSARRGSGYGGSWKDILEESRLQDCPSYVIVTTRLTHDATLWCEVLHLGGDEVLAMPFEWKYSTVSARVGAIGSRQSSADHVFDPPLHEPEQMPIDLKGFEPI